MPSNNITDKDILDYYNDNCKYIYQVKGQLFVHNSSANMYANANNTIVKVHNINDVKARLTNTVASDLSSYKHKKEHKPTEHKLTKDRALTSPANIVDNIKYMTEDELIDRVEEALAYQSRYTSQPYYTVPLPHNIMGIVVLTVIDKYTKLGWKVVHHWSDKLILSVN